MLNRLGLGFGVLCGLEVCAVGDAVVVRPGIAIDGRGREIVVGAPPHGWTRRSRLPTPAARPLARCPTAGPSCCASTTTGARSIHAAQRTADRRHRDPARAARRGVRRDGRHSGATLDKLSPRGPDDGPRPLGRLSAHRRHRRVALRGRHGGRAPARLLRRDAMSPTILQYGPGLQRAATTGRAGCPAPHRWATGTSAAPRASSAHARFARQGWWGPRRPHAGPALLPRALPAATTRCCTAGASSAARACASGRLPGRSRARICPLPVRRRDRHRGPRPT